MYFQYYMYIILFSLSLLTIALLFSLSYSFLSSSLVRFLTNNVFIYNCPSIVSAMIMSFFFVSPIPYVIIFYLRWSPLPFWYIYPHLLSQPAASPFFFSNNVDIFLTGSTSEPDPRGRPDTYLLLPSRQRNVATSRPARRMKLEQPEVWEAQGGESLQITVFTVD